MTWASNVVVTFDEHDRLRQIADLAERVREAQRKYFKTRDRSDLVASKQLEHRLDDLLASARREPR